MPKYMDVHTVKGAISADDVAKAHVADLKVQGKHGVKYINYWLDEKAGKIFCLAEAPSKEAAIAVHKEAHGLLADEIYEVKEGEPQKGSAVGRAQGA